MRWNKRKTEQETAIEKMSDEQLMLELHRLDDEKQAIRERMLLVNAEHTKRTEARKNPAGIEIHL